MATAKPHPKGVQPLCCVRIDFHSLLMPADKGRKLVELLESAAQVRQRYDGGAIYELTGDDLEVEYQTVKASQVRRPASSSGATQGLLPVEPLKLTGGAR